MARKAKAFCTYCRKRAVSFKNGTGKCSSCGGLTWSPLDEWKPGSGRGYACWKCDRKSVRWLGEVRDIIVWRCTICGAVYVEPFEDE